MPSTSKSSRRRKGKKPKKRWQVKQPTCDWLELPLDVMAHILYRVSVYDILVNAQRVCTTWRNICKDPAMWRDIYIDNQEYRYRGMWKHAVDKSQGQLLDLTIKHCFDSELFEYVAGRSSQLKRLEIIYSFDSMCEDWGDILKKFPFLEELSLYCTKYRVNHMCEDIKTAGRYCPLLKTLRVNQKALCVNIENDGSQNMIEDDEPQNTLFNIEDNESQNAMAIAIGKNLPALRHLELVGNIMSNIGLKAILGGCCHLETLDLRRCLYIDLKGDMGKESVKQIKNLKLPDDSLDDYPYILRKYVGKRRRTYCDCCCWGTCDDYVNDDYDYEDYDDYTFDFEDFSVTWKIARKNNLLFRFGPDTQTW